MKKLILTLTALFLCARANSQSIVQGEEDVDKLKRYQAVSAFTSGSKSSLCVTSTGTKRIYLEYVVVKSSAAANVTFERGGTAPTATAVTALQRNATSGTETPQAVAYTGASDAGAGTTSVTLGPLVASTDTTYSFGGEAWNKKAAQCLTVTPASGNGQVIFYWGEKN